MEEEGSVDMLRTDGSTESERVVEGDNERKVLLLVRHDTDADGSISLRCLSISGWRIRYDR